MAKAKGGARKAESQMRPIPVRVGRRPPPLNVPERNLNIPEWTPAPANALVLQKGLGNRMVSITTPRNAALTGINEFMVRYFINGEVQRGDWGPRVVGSVREAKRLGDEFIGGR